MDYIIRIPLVTFDIYDESEVDQNFQFVKDAIKVSSEVLYQEIKDSNYSSLSPTLKMKVYKYLLRGKYRGTPFGKWVGSGLGVFGESHLLEIKQVNYHVCSTGNEGELHSRKHQSKSSSYILNPGFKAYDGYYICDQFSEQAEKWENMFIGAHPVVAFIYQYFQQQESLTFRLFKTWFKDVIESEIQSYWDNLIASGILVSASYKVTLKKEDSCYVDSYVEGNFELPVSIKNSLDHVSNEIGGLFKLYNTTYMSRFLELFHQNFDDRAVDLIKIFDPIHSLGEFVGKVINIPTERDHDLLKNRVMLELCKGSLEVDLKAISPTSAITDCRSMTYMFKVNQNQEIIIENMVCNKPLVYLGRHDKIKLLRKYGEKIVRELYDNSKVIYAEIEISEKDHFRQLMNHQPYTPYVISCISQSAEEGYIPPDRLLIGLVDQEVVLFDKKLKRRVIPIISHPLSGLYISHPISKLMWEIANQNLPQFQFYREKAFTGLNYIPRLRWGNVILQPRKWKLHEDVVTSTDELRSLLQTLNIPNQILAGLMDLELSLDWSKTWDLDILFQELKKVKAIEVRENLYQGLRCTQEDPMYPQYIYTHAYQVNKDSSLKMSKLNPVERKSESWLYFKIEIPEDLGKYFLSVVWAKIFESVFKNEDDRQWFYLHYYNPNHELRIRVELKEKEERSYLINQIFGAVVRRMAGSKISLCDYYPETRKYSKEDLSISENLFSLESSLVFESIAKSYLLSGPILGFSAESILIFMLRIWIPLVGKDSLWDVLKRHIHGMIRGIDKPDFVDMRQVYSSSIQGNLEESIEIESFAINYQKILETHSFYHRPRKCKDFILNHIHMMCNRFFLHESSYYETLFIYCLYRELGKRRFKGVREKGKGALE
ncbi:thiopeptide-type bacteriocin biosynthesis domain-containing protein [Belliella buryatensis]|uniref:Thiopeptide-type bacteriocin biosynthesis domain-containing protein n=2 Tax=Belliella buryatensis TaxID=1500549 RepID=A0A239H0V1_9BACT|nr:thiopeptide-type bacteriocin biosynthesis domain-containing protein [Belliella buryatensis]